MASPGAFETNLARLRRRNPRVATDLDAIGEQGGGVEVVEGPRGDVTLSADGVLLASAYDPRGEGERLADEMAEKPADLMIAIGFALGDHLVAYRARHGCPLIVYEPSLHRLRGALAARPGLTLLGQPDVYLATDDDTLVRLVQALYSTGIRMQVYPHPAMLRIDPEAVTRAVMLVGRGKDANDANIQTRVLMSYEWARIAVDNVHDLIASAPFSALADRFRGAPAVVCAAGPSLDKQLPLLREQRDRLLVVAIGQTFGALRDAGIEPDVVHIVESQDVAHQIAGEPSDAALVVPPSVHPAVFEAPLKRRFIEYQATNPVACWLGRALAETLWLPGGATVAQSAVQIASYMGANPIMLIGQDLAFTDGKVYASGSSYGSLGMEQTEDGHFVYTNQEVKAKAFRREIRTVRRRVVWVDGWDGEKLPTSPSYAAFIHYYRDIAPFLDSRGVRLVNCTEGGARLPGIDHVPFAEMLAELPTEELHGAERIREAYEERANFEVDVFDEPIAEARGVMDRLQTEAERGATVARQAVRELQRARKPEHQLTLLHRLSRHENRVRRRLAEASWLDSLVQPELAQSICRQRSADGGGETDPDEVVDVLRHLFEATVKGVKRARGLVDRLERELSRGAEAS